MNLLLGSCLKYCVAGKLLGRTHKIAYNLLHKVGPKGDPGVKVGDRVSDFYSQQRISLNFE